MIWYNGCALHKISCYESHPFVICTGRHTFTYLGIIIKYLHNFCTRLGFVKNSQQNIFYIYHTLLIHLFTLGCSVLSLILPDEKQIYGGLHAGCPHSLSHLFKSSIIHSALCALITSSLSNVSTLTLRLMITCLVILRLSAFYDVAAWGRNPSRWPPEESPNRSPLCEIISPSSQSGYVQTCVHFVVLLSLFHKVSTNFHYVHHPFRPAEVTVQVSATSWQECCLSEMTF